MPVGMQPNLVALHAMVVEPYGEAVISNSNVTGERGI